jgi:hypothetical protein
MVHVQYRLLMPEIKNRIAGQDSSTIPAPCTCRLLWKRRSVTVVDYNKITRPRHSQKAAVGLPQTPAHQLVVVHQQDFDFTGDHAGFWSRHFLMVCASWRASYGLLR